MFPNYNGFQLEINNRKISGKFSNIWKSNDILLNKPPTREKKLKRNW